jgi:hypothetical protein
MEFQFWQSYSKGFKILFYFLLSIFFIQLLFAITAFAVGDSFTYAYSTTGEWKSIDLILDVFSLNQLPITQKSNEWLIIQNYSPVDLQHSSIGDVLLITGIAIALSIFITLFTYLELYYFIASMLGVFLFLGSLHFEAYAIFSLENKIPLSIALLSIGGLSYYYQSIKITFPFIYRVLSYLLLFVVFAVIIYFGTPYTSTLEVLSAYSLGLPIILMFLFFILTGGDMVYLFVYISNKTKSNAIDSKHSGWNFVLMAAIYYINMILLILQKTHYVSIDLITIPPFVLICINLIIGLWVLSTKSHGILNKLFPFKPYGSLLYMAFAIVTMSFIGYAYLGANDALIRYIEISFLYIHFGIGCMFFIYTLFNFWKIFEQKMDVYKIFYQPNIFSLFYVNLISGLFIIAFSTFGGISMHRNALSGYHTGIGDAYSNNDENILAEGFYLQSIKHINIALKPNYALANLYQHLKQENDEFQALQRCLNSNTEAIVFARLNAFYQRHHQYFPSLFMLQDGLAKHPNNRYLLVNCGTLFAQKSLYDSATFYFEKALHQYKDEVAATNLLSIYAQTKQVDKYEQLMSEYPQFSSVAFLSNKLGSDLLLSKASTIELPTEIKNDSILDGYNYTFMYNYALNHLSNPDTSLSKLLVRYIQQPKNEAYKESLIYLKGIYDYYSSTKVIDGVQDLMYLVEQHNNVHYIEFLGNMQLKAGMYKEAYETFSKLLINPTQKLLLQKCITGYLIGTPSNDLSIVGELSKSEDTLIAHHAKILLLAQQSFNTLPWSTLTDKEKNEVFYYKKNQLTVDEFKSIIAQIKDKQLSALTFVQYIETCINKNETATVLAIWNAMPKSDDTHEAIITEGNLQYLRLLTLLNDPEAIENELKQTQIPNAKKGYLNYFKGLVNWMKKDSTQALIDLKKAVDEVGYKEEVCNAYIRLKEGKWGAYKTLDDLNHIKLTHVYSTKLSLTYLDMCLDLGLSSSAEMEYNRMRNYYSDEENKTALDIISRAGVVTLP